MEIGGFSPAAVCSALSFGRHSFHAAGSLRFGSRVEYLAVETINRLAFNLAAKTSTNDDESSFLEWTRVPSSGDALSASNDVTIIKKLVFLRANVEVPEKSVFAASVLHRDEESV